MPETVADLQGAKWEQNPRRISEQQLARLKKSVERLGDLSPIIFNRRLQKLCGGHQRISVMPAESAITIDREYSAPTRTGTVAEGSVVIDGERYSYRVVDWSETDHSIAAIAANQQGGQFDWQLLSPIVQELDALEIDTELLGFEDWQLQPLLSTDGQSNAPPDSEPPQPPNQFKEYDENVHTEYRCPKCKYEWSGSPSPGEASEAEVQDTVDGGNSGDPA